MPSVDSHDAFYAMSLLRTEAEVCAGDNHVCIRVANTRGCKGYDRTVTHGLTAWLDLDDARRLHADLTEAIETATAKSA